MTSVFLCPDAHPPAAVCCAGTNLFPPVRGLRPHKYGRPAAGPDRHFPVDELYFNVTTMSYHQFSSEMTALAWLLPVTDQPAAAIRDPARNESEPTDQETRQ